MLPEAVRSKMETALRADFSAVRVHIGPQAQRIGAVAFTIGSDIYFAPGRFQPDTIHGQQLLGHELAHVVQQRQGRARNPAGAGVVVVQDRLLEAEADRLGYLAAAQRTTASASLPARLPPPRPRGAVQRMEQMSVDKEPASPEPQEPAMNFFLLPPSVRNQIIGYVKHEEPNLDTPRRVSKEFLAETERVRAISDPSVWELEVDPGEDPGLAPEQKADHYVAQMLLMEQRAEISYSHMREMVKSKNKLGELDHGKHEEDKLAVRLLQNVPKQAQNNCAAVVLRRTASPVVAYNEPLKHKTTKKRSGEVVKNIFYAQLDEVFGEGANKYELITSNVPYQHAETRLWEHFAADPSVVYIGIWQPCCLFCAAQLIAAGFSGFGGCHGNVYGQYVFSRRILGDPFRRARFLGTENAVWFETASARDRLLFLHALAALGKNPRFKERKAPKEKKGPTKKARK